MVFKLTGLGVDFAGRQAVNVAADKRIRELQRNRHLEPSCSDSRN